MKNKGMSQHRFAQNPEEQRFAEAWDRTCSMGRTLAYLLDPDHGAKGKPADPIGRDVIVAATVVQWLGSPVGQGFLGSLGYVRLEPIDISDVPTLKPHQVSALRTLALDPAASSVLSGTLSKLRKTGLVGKVVGKDAMGRQKTTSPITPKGTAYLASLEGKS